MPQTDLSAVVPPAAAWVKIRYEIRPKTTGAHLIARVWSGPLDDAVVLKGSSGEAVVRLHVPQTISYQNPVNVELKLKVVGYKTPEPS